MKFRLMAISDRQSLPDQDLERWAMGLARSGVECLQVREKDLDDRALFELALRIRRCFPPPRLLVINGRIDVALGAGADGVHLPANGLPLRALRQRFGKDILLGRSAHHPEEVSQARRDGADYVTFGPVFSTPSKKRYGEPVGLVALRRATACGVPVLALGGMRPDRLQDVAEQGATGAAGIGVFREQSAAAEMVLTARRCWP
jgi:thiamine-phosphate pyrophosphorylase